MQGGEGEKEGGKQDWNEAWHRSSSAFLNRLKNHFKKKKNKDTVNTLEEKEGLHVL